MEDTWNGKWLKVNVLMSGLVAWCLFKVSYLRKNDAVDVSCLNAVYKYNSRYATHMKLFKL